MHEGVLRPVAIVVFLLFLAAVSAIVVRRIRFPYTIGLVLVGLGLGFLAAEFEALKPLRRAQLTPDIILFLILPTLLFEASIKIHARVLIQNLGPILLFATVGLLVSATVVGVGVCLFTPLGWGTALLFGALISATDPVAVIALFKELGVSVRLSTLVDGESLFNDATAIVVFKIVLGIVTTGGAVTAGLFVEGFGQFLLVFGGGLALGVALGAFILWMISLAQGDPLVQIALTSVLAYLAFIVADHLLHVSGVMAVVGAGLYGAWRAPRVIDAQVRDYILQFWEFAAFVANSLIFLLIGLTEVHLFEDLGHFQDHGLYVGVAVLSALVARAVVVFGFAPIGNRWLAGEPVDGPCQAVIFWGGLRGAIPLALVLGLPADFQHRDLLIDLTLGTVLFSLIVQGTTVGRLIRRFDLGQADEEQASEGHPMRTPTEAAGS